MPETCKTVIISESRQCGKPAVGVKRFTWRDKDDPNRWYQRSYPACSEHADEVKMPQVRVEKAQ